MLDFPSFRELGAGVSILAIGGGLLWNIATTTHRFETVEKAVEKQVPRFEALARTADQHEWRLQLLERQLARIEEQGLETNKAVLDIREAMIRMGVRFEGLVPKEGAK